ncbi:hypothetical protein BHE75_03377 [Sphingomonas haloaromaticamans]|uniref:Uncharacterized protein n=1 Tax=Edaphosphingomonas haloaromaticamans TaxID=653954 RepID=A0A1S1HLG7_9SPHN|nr:hypothetical protein BHE75_03377 [Sphingomonas haloaromaticamans]
MAILNFLNFVGFARDDALPSAGPAPISAATKIMGLA